MLQPCSVGRASPSWLTSLRLLDLLLQRVEILVLEFEDQFVKLAAKVLIDTDGVPTHVRSIRLN